MNDITDNYRILGYVGPINLVSEVEANALYSSLASESKPPVWDKALANVSEVVYGIATRNSLLNLIEEFIGPNILLWGACLVTKRPDEPHPWHTDIETVGNPEGTSSVWIGLANTSKKSSLKLVTHSHMIGQCYEELCCLAGRQPQDLSDDEVLELAREHSTESKIARPSLRNGQAIIFNGNVWHGSHNTMADKSRTALLLQYSRPEITIRVPDSRNHYQWPFEYLDLCPPTILVRGHANDSRNKIVQSKFAKNYIEEYESEARAVMESSIKVSSFPKFDPSVEGGWSYEYLVETSTVADTYFSVHASRIASGVKPHGLHSHAEEEVLVLLCGCLEVEQVISPENDDIRKDIVGPGSVVYHPAYQSHTFKNVGEGPACYYVIKWRMHEQNREVTTTPMLFNRDTPLKGRKSVSSDGSGFSVLHSGETAYLQKLHIHLDSFPPETGYKRHRDPYDVLLIVLEGSCEILGKKIEKGGMVFHPANSDHDLLNRDDAAAEVLVLEFHGVQQKLQNDVSRLRELQIWDSDLSSSASLLSEILAPGSRIILVDDDQVGISYFKDYTAAPFLEYQGEYWGPPPFDVTAIEELERMRSEGYEYMVFLWPAFWWLGYYREFADYLATEYETVVDSAKLKVFRL